jgi:hypothetical protein
MLVKLNLPLNLKQFEQQLKQVCYITCIVHTSKPTMVLSIPETVPVGEFKGALNLKLIVLRCLLALLNR